MRKTYKFKAKLSKTTEQNAIVWLGLCQKLYNLALEQRVTAYRCFSVSLTTYDQHKELPELKKAFPEFKQINSQVLQETLDRLGKAFGGFFSRLKKVGEKAGFPRFKSYHRYDSFTLKQTGWKLDGRHLKIKGIGIFKLFLSREIEGRIKTVTVRRDSCGDLCPSEGIGGWHFPVMMFQSVAFQNPALRWWVLMWVLLTFPLTPKDCT